MESKVKNEKWAFRNPIFTLVIIALIFISFIFYKELIDNVHEAGIKLGNIFK